MAKKTNFQAKNGSNWCDERYLPDIAFLRQNFGDDPFYEKLKSMLKFVSYQSKPASASQPAEYNQQTEEEPEELNRSTEIGYIDTLGRFLFNDKDGNEFKDAFGKRYRNGKLKKCFYDNDKFHKFDDSCLLNAVRKRPDAKTMATIRTLLQMSYLAPQVRLRSILPDKRLYILRQYHFPEINFDAVVKLKGAKSVMNERRAEQQFSSNVKSVVKHSASNCFVNPTSHETDQPAYHSHIKTAHMVDYGDSRNENPTASCSPSSMGYPETSTGRRSNFNVVNTFNTNEPKRTRITYNSRLVYEQIIALVISEQLKALKSLPPLLEIHTRLNDEKENVADKGKYKCCSM